MRLVGVLCILLAGWALGAVPEPSAHRSVATTSSPHLTSPPPPAPGTRGIGFSLKAAAPISPNAPMSPSVRIADGPDGFPPKPSPPPPAL